MPDHCYVTIKISGFCVKYHIHQFASYLLKMSLLERRKPFVFWNFIKTTHGHVFNADFRQNFQSSHQTNVSYRNGMRNLRRDVCALGKELPRHLQLKRLKEFKTSSGRAPGSQSEELFVNFRCLQQLFGK